MSERKTPPKKKRAARNPKTKEFTPLATKDQLFAAVMRNRRLAAFDVLFSRYDVSLLRTLARTIAGEGLGEIRVPRPRIGNLGTFDTITLPEALQFMADRIEALLPPEPEG